MPKHPDGPGSPVDMLGEECCEAAKEVFKAARFGMDARYAPRKYTTTDGRDIAYTETTPRERLIQEVGDIMVTIELCVRRGFFTWADIEAAAERKRTRLVDLFGHDYIERMPHRGKNRASSTSTVPVPACRSRSCRSTT
jgi:hypothetical protein